MLYTKHVIQQTLVISDYQLIDHVIAINLFPTLILRSFRALLRVLYSCHIIQL